MNYLAHLYLADGTPESIVGNLLGDFVKGAAAKERYSPGIRLGIDLHRRVDAYTDSHRVVLEAKRLVSPPRRRFAGILVDLYFDHLLARRWEEFSAVGLDDFARQVYATLQAHRAILPGRLQQALPFMVAENWLASYREVGGIAKAIDGISRRLRRENAMAGGVAELEVNYAAYEASFAAFFPEVINFVKGQTATR